MSVLKDAMATGLLHPVNHGLEPHLFHVLRGTTYTYMTTASMEEKDSVEAVDGTGSFEGYKPRSEQEKRQGLLPVIEEYNYDYRSTGTVRRPQVIRENEASAREVFDFYHAELTPRLLDLINRFTGLPSGYLKEVHQESSEIAHMLLYHPRWYLDERRKRAAYAGHTDIGSITYLYANPVATLQVYGSQGWEYVAYIPNSIVINMGDAMHFITKGLVNATLHRVIKPAEQQAEFVRTALVYFVHPGQETMHSSLRQFKALRSKYTAETLQSPGCPIDAIALNRVISSISALRDDEYLAPVDSSAWEATRAGGLVKSPSAFCVDYDSLVLRPRPIGLVTHSE
ncbi:hypothetical protein BGZ57DRAFT_827594 [Hyaloscypha finlandica]|nr:hypothetical protein BGZ57DRAFT_827594 [Hyaloscypha finlandica]